MGRDRLSRHNFETSCHPCRHEPMICVNAGKRSIGYRGVEPDIFYRIVRVQISARLFLSVCLCDGP